MKTRDATRERGRKTAEKRLSERRKQCDFFRFRTGFYKTKQQISPEDFTPETGFDQISAGAVISGFVFHAESNAGARTDRADKIQ